MSALLLTQFGFVLLSPSFLPWRRILTSRSHFSWSPALFFLFRFPLTKRFPARSQEHSKMFVPPNLYRDTFVSFFIKDFSPLGALASTNRTSVLPAMFSPVIHSRFGQFLQFPPRSPRLPLSRDPTPRKPFCTSVFTYLDCPFVMSLYSFSVRPIWDFDTAPMDRQNPAPLVCEPSAAILSPNKALPRAQHSVLYHGSRFRL